MLITDEKTQQQLENKIKHGDKVKNELCTSLAKSIVEHCKENEIELRIDKEIIQVPTALMPRKYYFWQVFKDGQLKADFSICSHIYPSSDGSKKARDFVLFHKLVKRL